MNYGSSHSESHFSLTPEENDNLLNGETISHVVQANYGDFKFTLKMETIHLYDIKREELCTGDNVVVLDPEGPEDKWQHAFQGTITAITGKSLLITDQEDNLWSVTTPLKVIKD